MPDLCATVFGDDLVLSTQPDGCLVLYHLSDQGRARRLGTFADITSVWKAVDLIDTPSRGAVAA